MTIRELELLRLCPTYCWREADCCISQKVAITFTVRDRLINSFNMDLVQSNVKSKIRSIVSVGDVFTLWGEGLTNEVVENSFKLLSKRTSKVI